MWPVIDAYVCFVLCDVQSDLYCTIEHFIIVLLSGISDDGFYVYVHRSLEDILNMNMNTFEFVIRGAIKINVLCMCM